ncbi:thioredoxin [Methylobacterium sp. Leaf469]|jgi:thiol-disulfide isomerase/thioredoxin|uniref:thioredoxin family protein n=1 Tax=unclassified Methylobacterium TaxID=2615210 RepID=UPI0006F77A61|nr:MULTISPECIES: thioredoxin family protein [unclassified Methylobacterium]USU33742.1 thioredoxin family protein [Methylobacterium sp. OTU13CASTA1]KQO65919.1 thioredoxin [Methylobacterium sp. Leaf87]KQP18897.1 thioredoxin [Methylobacterium sp. Leaf100]KQP34629.1 thioredoxin [Methylobacterium sp. Leaf102]KQP72018.1 thioredoxin [Methylobacterium sp. Leaf112]
MMMRRALLGLAAFLPLAVLAMPAQADPMPFEAGAFAAAQKAGRPILVEVSAPWCPICKTQKPILAKLAQDPRFKDLVIFDVDFDSRKDVLRRFDARMQSTLIVFKGETETGRSVGETQPEWIEGLVEKAL